MDSFHSTEHIKNDDVRFIYDSIFKKLSSTISRTPLVTDELYYWANVMFQKYKIQFYSIMQLTYEGTKNTYSEFEYFDIVSIHTLIRSCFETFLTFDYIYIHSSTLDEILLKFLFYKYHGLKDIKSISLKDTQKYKDTEASIQKIHGQIVTNGFFKSLSRKEKDNLFRSWKPSWSTISNGTILSNWNGRNQYNLLSQYAHNSYSALMTIDYYYRNLDKYDKDAINCQLYETSTLFVESLTRLFHIDLSIFTDDEIAIMGEFKYMSTLEQNEISSMKNSLKN